MQYRRRSPLALADTIPFALLGGTAVVEVIAIRGRRDEAQDRDRGSLPTVQLLTLAGYVAAFGLWRASPPPILGGWAVWTGAAVAVCGMALRLWSIATLGRYFTVAVRVAADQPIVDRGPYAVLRHPSYTGSLLMALGTGLSLGYGLGPLLCAGPQFLSFLLRMRVEEHALLEALGEPYRAYMARTKRLIPFIW